MAIINQGNHRYYIWDKIFGLNTSGDKFNLGTNYLADLLNGYIDSSPDGQGAIQQRPGTQKLSATVIKDSDDAPARITVLEEVQWNDGTRELFCRGGDGWRRINLSTGAVTLVDDEREDDSKGQLVKWYDTTDGEEYVIMVDSDGARKCDSAYDVTDLSADTDCPSDPTAVWVHAGRVWLNSIAAPTKIYGSAVGDATSATAFSSSEDSIVVDLQQYMPKGDKVLGFRSLGTQLLVIFCRHQAIVYYAPAVHAEITYRQTINAPCLSNNAILQIANDYVFCSLSGVRSFISSEASQDLDVKDLTALINNSYRSQIANAYDVESICSGIDMERNHAYFTIQTVDGKAAETFVFGIDIGAVVGRYQFGAVPYSYASGQDAKVYFGGNDGYVYQITDSALDDEGKTIPFEVEFAPFGGESVTLFKHPRMIEMVVKTNKDVDLAINYGFGHMGQSGSSDAISVAVQPTLWRSAVWRRSYWRGGGRAMKRSWNLIGRGRVINMNIRHTTPGARIRLSSLALKTIIGGEK